MTSKNRPRARSSVDHIFELVGDLEEDQLQDLLHELNSSTEGNVPVSQAVEFFDERLRQPDPRSENSKHPLRPTPSFINQPHEPVDWPRQKPRPVSGSQWRQNMRIVSTPYGNLARHQTEPISPPLTASPPSSPPLSPPKSAVGNASPRRSVTAPVLKRGTTPRVEVQPVSPESPVSPPRHLDVDADEHPRPSLSEFGSFSFGGLDGTAESRPERRQEQEEHDEEERPVSPSQSRATPPPQPDFSRINTMPLPTTLQHEPFDTFHDLPRPRTAAGDAAPAFKPRAFRRISRPVFLSPVHVPAPDDLAKKLSAYAFEGLPSPPPTVTATPRPAAERDSAPSSLEAMLKEPLLPRSQFLFGHVEREVPSVSGIFEVLTEG